MELSDKNEKNKIKIKNNEEKEEEKNKNWHTPLFPFYVEFSFLNYASMCAIYMEDQLLSHSIGRCFSTSLKTR